MREKLQAGLGALALAAACGSGEPAATNVSAPAPSSVVTLSAEAARLAGIRLAAVERRELGRTLALTGTLAAVPWIAEEQSALTEAESASAQLRLAEASFERLTRLLNDGIVARQDLDTARAARDQARAAAAMTDARLANLGLGRDARELERRASIWGLATLPESELAEVKLDDAVGVETAPYPEHSFAGRVVDISRSADPESRAFTVRIAIVDKKRDLRPQMLATFEVSLHSSPSLVIPRSAVLLEGDGSWVYVAQGETYRRTPIRQGASTPDAVAVLEGLVEGEQVVVAGAQLLESERLKSRLRPEEAD